MRTGQRRRPSNSRGANPWNPSNPIESVLLQVVEAEPAVALVRARLPIADCVDVGCELRTANKRRTAEFADWAETAGHRPLRSMVQFGYR